MPSLLRVARFVFGGLVFFSLSACSSGPAEPVSVTDLWPLDEAAVRFAPSTVAVAGTEISLEASVWRNWMPGSDDGGLILSAWLVAKSGRWPVQVRFEKPIVVRGNLAWDADFTDESHPAEPGRRERMARRGPDWQPPAIVDVIVRLDYGDGHAMYVAHRNVPIENPM